MKSLKLPVLKHSNSTISSRDITVPKSTFYKKTYFGTQILNSPSSSPGNSNSSSPSNSARRSPSNSPKNFSSFKNQDQKKSRFYQKNLVEIKKQKMVEEETKDDSKSTISVHSEIKDEIDECQSTRSEKEKTFDETNGGFMASKSPKRGPNEKLNLKKIVLKSLKDRELTQELDSPTSVKSGGHNTMSFKEEKAKIILPYAHLIHGPIESKEQFNKFMLLTFKGVFYSKNAMNDRPNKNLESKRVILDLPKDTENRKPVMLLDLDETMVASQAVETPGSIKLLIPELDRPVYTKIRPFAMDFLENMSKFYYIFVFTAANDSYAASVVDLLDPNMTFIRGIISRENCIKTIAGCFVKDLRIIVNCDLKQMVIVDNLTHSFASQLDNGIPILEWNPEVTEVDTELKHIQKYLKDLSTVEDIPAYNRSKLKLKNMDQYKLDTLLMN
jgi:CTD small phosphatase-like protein 2